MRNRDRVDHNNSSNERKNDRMTVAGVFLVCAATLVAASGCARRDAVELPTPRTRPTATALCQPATLIPGDAWPSCAIPGDPCQPLTLTVEVDARGTPKQAYVAEHRDASLDACFTSAVQAWEFIPARDCEGGAIASRWQEGYSIVCDDVVAMGATGPRARK